MYVCLMFDEINVFNKMLRKLASLVWRTQNRSCGSLLADIFHQRLTRATRGSTTVCSQITDRLSAENVLKREFEKNDAHQRLKNPMDSVRKNLNQAKKLVHAIAQDSTHALSMHVSSCPKSLPE